MTRVAVLLASLALAGCGTAPAQRAQCVEAGAEVTLAPGEAVSLGSSDLTVRFLAVSADSRCPRDVQCIWAGEVKVQLEIEDGRARSKVEVIGGSNAVSGDWRVTLVRVDPQTSRTSKIAPAGYRATIKVEKGG